MKTSFTVKSKASNLKHFIKQIPRSIKKDLTIIKKSNNVLIFADVIRNLYETSKGKCNKLLTENIKKTHKNRIVRSLTKSTLKQRNSRNL